MIITIFSITRRNKSFLLQTALHFACLYHILCFPSLDGGEKNQYFSVKLNYSSWNLKAGISSYSYFMKHFVTLSRAFDPLRLLSIFPLIYSSPYMGDTYLINQARGSYWENIGPRSWLYGLSAARSVQTERQIFFQYCSEGAWLTRDLLHDFMIEKEL